MAFYPLEIFLVNLFLVLVILVMLFSTPICFFSD